MWFVAFCCFLPPFFSPPLFTQADDAHKFGDQHAQGHTVEARSRVASNQGSTNFKFLAMFQMKLAEHFWRWVLDSSTSNNSTMSFRIRIDLRCFSLLISLCVSCLHNECSVSISFRCKYSPQKRNSLLRTEFVKLETLELAWIWIWVTTPIDLNAIYNLWKNPRVFLPRFAWILRITLCT